MSTIRSLKYHEALNEALVQAMDLDPEVFVMGCGVDDDGGIFGTTKAAFAKYGAGRVMDVPLAENAIAGIGIGAAIMGKRPVIVHARNDFLLLAMDQIINHGAKWNIMSGGRLFCPMVVRAIVGRGWGQAAQHSQSLQALFSHIPGLKVALPTTAYDAKGLLLAALKDREPVIMIEHRLLYDLADKVPQEAYTVPLGKGIVRRSGSDVTIVAFSYMVKEAMEAAEKLSQEGLSVEVIDPRCSAPLDKGLILESVGKTERLVVADTSWASYGLSAEVAAIVSEEIPGKLKVPVRRVALPHLSTPCSHVLERDYYPNVDALISAVRKVMGADLQTDSASETKKISDEHLRFQGPF